MPHLQLHLASQAGQHNPRATVFSFAEIEWGGDRWKKTTWRKVFVAKDILDLGFSYVTSDVDVVWFRDPLPLFEKHPFADIIFGHDGYVSWNEEGEEGFDTRSGPGWNVNTGGLGRHLHHAGGVARAAAASDRWCAGLGLQRTDAMRGGQASAVVLQW